MESRDKRHVTDLKPDWLRVSSNVTYPVVLFIQWAKRQDEQSK